MGPLFQPDTGRPSPPILLRLPPGRPQGTGTSQGPSPPWGAVTCFVLVKSRGPQGALLEHTSDAFSKAKSSLLCKLNSVTVALVWPLVFRLHHTEIHVPVEGLCCTVPWPRPHCTWRAGVGPGRGDSRAPETCAWCLWTLPWAPSALAEVALHLLPAINLSHHEHNAGQSPVRTSRQSQNWR